MMNERILELAEESGFIVEDEEIYANELFHEITKDMEKFAELIIQECIRLGEESQYKCRTFPVSVAIKDHFGIK
jgi:Na+-transporting NADH:ubiquinone oxidoreductase subunit NqrD